MWLDDTRGHLTDWVTQRWVRLTGRRLSPADRSWLDGPAGRPTGIGPEFFEDYAVEHGLHVIRSPSSGLLHDFEMLRGSTFDPSDVSPAVVRFYGRTATYDLDVWSEWCGVFRPFGRLLAVLFSRRLRQLNVPLSSLDTSRGITSDVFPVVDPGTNQTLWTAWVRRATASGRVIYAGAYSAGTVPRGSMRCVKVVFPLPNGNAIVLIEPRAQPDGSLLLVSAGAGFGSPGFYFTVHNPDGTTSARYVRSLRESIHVYETDGLVRADHVLSIWRLTFLRLHYRLRAKAGS